MLVPEWCRYGAEHTPRTCAKLTKSKFRFGGRTYHISIRPVGRGMPLVRSIQGWELDGVPDEEDRLFRVNTSRLSMWIQRTVLLNTQSRFPSSVYIFIAQPCTSRIVSADPRSGPTVEMRRRHLDLLPTLPRKLAEVRSEQSSVTSNSPYALVVVRVQIPIGEGCRRTLLLSRGRR